MARTTIQTLLIAIIAVALTLGAVRHVATEPRSFLSGLILSLTGGLITWLLFAALGLLSRWITRFMDWLSRY